MAEGRVRFPLGDFDSGEAADASSSYGSHPAAMAEGERVDRFDVVCHVHFEHFADDLWPACDFAAHSTQGTFAHFIQIPMNIVHWSFNFSQQHSTETAQAPEVVHVGVHFLQLHIYRSARALNIFLAFPPKAQFHNAPWTHTII